MRMNPHYVDNFDKYYNTMLSTRLRKEKIDTDGYRICSMKAPGPQSGFSCNVYFYLNIFVDLLRNRVLDSIILILSSTVYV